MKILGRNKSGISPLKKEEFGKMYKANEAAH
jgi:hypothetical protein